MTRKRFIKLMMAEGFSLYAIYDAAKQIQSQQGYSYDEAYHCGCCGESGDYLFIWFGA